MDPLQASIQLSAFFGRFNATDGNEPVVMQMSTVLASERRSLIMTALTSVGVPEEKLTPAQVMARKSVEYFQMQQASRAGVGSTAARKASRLRGSRPEDDAAADRAARRDRLLKRLGLKGTPADDPGPSQSDLGVSVSLAEGSEVEGGLAERSTMSFALSVDTSVSPEPWGQPRHSRPVHHAYGPQAEDQPTLQYLQEHARQPSTQTVDAQPLSSAATRPRTSSGTRGGHPVAQQPSHHHYHAGWASGGSAGGAGGRPRSDPAAPGAASGGLGEGGGRGGGQPHPGDQRPKTAPSASSGGGVSGAHRPKSSSALPQKARHRAANPTLSTLPRALATGSEGGGTCGPARASSPPSDPEGDHGPASHSGASLPSVDRTRASVQHQRRAALRSRVEAYSITPEQDALAQRRLELAGIAPTFSSDPVVTSLPPEKAAMFGAGGAGKWGFAAPPRRVEYRGLLPPGR